MNKYIDTDFNKTVGIVLKEKREAKNISLEELAKKINYIVTRQTLFYYESGRSKIKVDTFVAICKALNIEPDELFEEINAKYFKNSKLNK